MKNKNNLPNAASNTSEDTRRAFLLGAGVLGASLPGRASARQSPVPDLLRPPDEVMAFAEGEPDCLSLTRSGSNWQARDIEVSAQLRAKEVGILVSAPKTRLTRIRLRWRGRFPETWRYLGDGWERSYGDLEWRGLVGERLMPWYFLASSAGKPVVAA